MLKTSGLYLTPKKLFNLEKLGTILSFLENSDDPIKVNDLT